jgi:hypothetical protein
MSKVATPEKTMAEYFKSSFTACGFLIAHYLYIGIYNFFEFTNYKFLSPSPTFIIYIALASLFFWLLKEAKKERTFSKMATILMIYFGERVFSLTNLLNSGDESAALVQLLICAPIIFFLIRGVNASIDLKSIELSSRKPVKRGR